MLIDRFNLELRSFLRLLAFFSCPLLVLIVLYVYTDPFKVIWQYEQFYPRQVAGGVSLNPAHVATQNYLRLQPSMHYDSFILGNSRSIYYPIEVWRRYLPASSRCYHYDAANESLLGLWQKLCFIERQHGDIRNVLMVVDAGLLAKVDCDHWHLCESPPELTGGSNRVSFHWYNLKAFLSPLFLAAYTDYRLFGKLRPYMLRNSLLTDDMFIYDAEGNECNFVPLEHKIEEGTYYDQRRRSVFDGAQFPDSVSPAVIGTRQRAILDSIAAVLARHDASVQIVISPLYNQIRINPSDPLVLEQIFGAGHVSDFSGPNRWNSDFHNYYETSHYRPKVAIAVMDSVYAPHSPSAQ